MSQCKGAGHVRPWFTELICVVLSSFTPSPSTITNSPIPLFKVILYSLPWVRKIVNWQVASPVAVPVQRSTVAVPCLVVNNSCCSLFRGQQQSLFPVQRLTTVAVPCLEVNNSYCSLFRGQQQLLFPVQRLTTVPVQRSTTVAVPVQRSTTVTVPCSEVNNSPCSEVDISHCSLFRG